MTDRVKLKKYSENLFVEKLCLLAVETAVMPIQVFLLLLLRRSNFCTVYYLDTVNGCV